MALGATTYKTPNIIDKIGSNMTAREGCGVYLGAADNYVPNTVSIAEFTSHVPYAIIVTGTDSLTPGSYPSAIGDASLELVDQLGCVVQVLNSGSHIIAAGDFLTIDPAYGDGTFISISQYTPIVGDWVWGYALTDAAEGQQCLMRFQPVQVQYVAP